MKAKRVGKAIVIAICALLGVVLGAPNQTHAQQTPAATRLPPATQGKAYSQVLTTARGKPMWVVTGGRLPAGLTLSPRRGVVGHAHR